MWCCTCVCLQKALREDLLPNPVFPAWRREAWCCSQLWHLSARAKISSEQSVCPAAASLAAAATGNAAATVIGHLLALAAQNICKSTATPTRWGQLLLETGHGGLKGVRNNFQGGQRLFSCKHVCHPPCHLLFLHMLPWLCKESPGSWGSAVWCQRVLSATCQHLGGEIMGESGPQLQSWGLWMWKIRLAGPSHFGELPLTAAVS